VSAADDCRLGWDARSAGSIEREPGFPEAGPAATTAGGVCLVGPPGIRSPSWRGRSIGSIWRPRPNRARTQVSSWRSRAGFWRFRSPRRTSPADAAPSCRVAFARVGVPDDGDVVPAASL